MKRKEEREQKAFEAAMSHGFNAPSYEAGAAWADKTMIEKACEWIRKGGSGWYLTTEFGENEIDFVKLAEDFRKAMEG